MMTGMVTMDGFARRCCWNLMEMILIFCDDGDGDDDDDDDDDGSDHDDDDHDE